MTLGRPGRLLAIALTLAFLAGGVVMTVRWLLGPENLAQVISGWVERELGAELSLGQPPGIRLVPRLQLTLDTIRIDRDGESLAAIDQLSLALPWSVLWRDGLRVESLNLRGPEISWPALTQLLAGFTDERDAERTPRLPQIAVGIRVENGTLLSGSTDEPWRIERISLVTTPLRSGRSFHLDAGARLRGNQVRTVSLTLTTRPAQANGRLQLDELAGRIIISPDNQPPAAEATIAIDGRVHLAEGGIALVDLDGTLPGWPDWAPDVLGFQADAPIAATARLTETGAPLALSLEQPAPEAESASRSSSASPPSMRTLAISIDPDSINAALSQLDRPLLAIGELHLQAAMNHLGIGPVQLHGLRLEIGPQGTDADSGDSDDPDSNTDIASDANTASGTNDARGNRSQP
ncbi:MAG: hypothetical protein M0Q42_10340 [Xanthomonadales bacterium]|nr:hypothetical protein [Xanthomonadales bacterium]